MRAFAHLVILYLARGRSIRYALAQSSRAFRAGL